MDTVRNILIRRDGMTAEEADTEIEDMKDRVVNGEDPEDVLYDIGLEPDYIFDILGG